jgi:hypothetical protein
MAISKEITTYVDKRMAEQRALIDALDKRVSALEGRVTALEAAHDEEPRSSELDYFVLDNGILV